MELNNFKVHLEEKMLKNQTKFQKAKKEFLKLLKLY